MAKNVVIISGNIGAGKSTVVNYLQQKGNFLCIPEFVDKTWRDHFYADRKSYTSYFEKSCLMARIARHITAKKHPEIVFFDRGLIDGREVFVQNSHDEGFLSFKQLNSYDHDLREALDSLGRTKEETGQWMETLIVYLRAPPKVCFDRQKVRKSSKGETGGETIPLEYFERIHNYYERFISRIEYIYKKWGLPVKPKLLVIDASQDISKNPQYLEEIYRKIRVALNLRDTSVQTRFDVSEEKVEYIHGNKSPSNQNPPHNYRVKNFPQQTMPKMPQQQQRPQTIVQNRPQNNSNQNQNQNRKPVMQIKPVQIVQNRNPNQNNPQNRPNPQIVVKVVRPWHVQRPNPIVLHPQNRNNQQNRPNQQNQSNQQRPNTLPNKPNPQQQNNRPQMQAQMQRQNPPQNKNPNQNKNPTQNNRPQMNAKGNTNQFKPSNNNPNNKSSNQRQQNGSGNKSSGKSLDVTKRDI